MKRVVIASLTAGLLALTGCIHVHEHEHAQQGGPPPWAPAHGHRYKHHGTDLIFDTDIGVYVVVDHPHVYFDDDYYFRRVDSRWERCKNWETAHWKTIDVDRVPRGLAKHYAKKGKKYGKGKGNEHGQGPAKHDD